jgi:hypothetical protein
MARSNRDLASGPVSSSIRTQSKVRAARGTIEIRVFISLARLLDGCEGPFNGAYDARRLIEEGNAIIEFGGQDALDQTCAEALAVGGFTLGPSCSFQITCVAQAPGSAHCRPAAAPDRDVHFRLNRTVLPVSGWALDRCTGVGYGRSAPSPQDL